MKTNPGEYSEQDEERKEFYKELFRFNALLDIAIDEEEFVLGEDNNIQKIKDKWNKAFQKRLEMWRFEDFDNIFKTSAQDKPNFNLQLQTDWEIFLNELGNDVAPQVKLRKKGIGLLLLAKYTRALQLADPLQEGLSRKQDTLTSFISANLSYLYTTSPNLTKESTYLQTLLLLECAACASGEATIGFLKLAESAIGRTGNSNVEDGERDEDGEEEFGKLIPYFKALVEYNKAVAFGHTGRKEEALDSSLEVIKLLRRECLGKNEKTRDPCAQSKQLVNTKQSIDPMTEEELRLYLEIPALHLKADLLSKMQCCFNAIETLQELLKKVKLDGKNSYKNVRARLLEIPCWLDMGDFHKAEQVVRDHLKNRVGKLLPKELMGELERCANLCRNKPKRWQRNKLQEWLKKFPSLRTDAIKLVLQWDHETWKYNILKKTSKSNVKEGQIKDIEVCISNLKTFIEIYKEDRFQRQNLKELAVAWLESLAEIKNVGDNEDCPITSKEWCKRIKEILSYLDINLGEKLSPINNKGDIANEIWGKSFKRLDLSLVERLLRILSKLTDHSAEFFHKKSNPSENEEVDTNKSKRDFLETLSKFEMKVLGLNKDEEIPAFFRGIEDGILPRDGDFHCRRTLRRGWVLKNNLKPVKNEFTWLDKEDKNVGDCLRKLKESWEYETRERDYYKTEKIPTIWLTDYSRIIGDSDFRKHLQSGRSEQPINVFISKDKKKLIGVEFVALRRWNSHTPEISFSKGGGYFVFIPVDINNDDKVNGQQGGVFRATKLGIVVDPGFDFIHNFFSQGFTLDDIDLVLITHADADHISDYAGLADLFRVRSKPGKDSKKIYTFIPRNAHKILNRYITDEAYRSLYYDTVLVDVNEDFHDGNKMAFFLKLPGENESSPPRMIIKKDEAECEGSFLEIECVPASHDDHADKRPGSFGYVLTFREKHKETKKIGAFGTIGFTGDSQWFPEYAEHFKKCDLVCSHMGSILGEEVEDYEKEQSLGDWEALIRKKNHPYLPGEVLFLEQLRKLEKSPEERIVVLSEFGEELKGLIRKDVCERLNRCMSLDSDGCWKNFSIQEKKTGTPEPREVEEGEKIQDYCKNCDAQHKEHKGHHKAQKEHNDKAQEEHNGTHIRTIPADIGLRISIRKGNKPTVHCVLCDRFHYPEDMKWIPHGSEEAMFYVCGPCYRSKSRDIRVAKYESILDSGRPVLRSRTIPEAEKSRGDN